MTLQQPRSLALHLVSDLDGTWLPAADPVPGLKALEAFLERHPGIVLTFATGRGLASALALLEQRVTLLPRHLATDVGTTLHHRAPDGRWLEDRGYARWAGRHWPAKLAATLLRAGLPEGVRLQPGVASSRRLALELEHGDLALAANRLRALLDRLGIRAEVLASHQQLLDVLPPGVDKGTAVRHLNIPLPMVACGDSENDLGLWRVADLPVLMADSPLAPALAGPGRARMVIPEAPGPAGILEMLMKLWTRGGVG